MASKGSDFLPFSLDRSLPPSPSEPNHTTRSLAGRRKSTSIEQAWGRISSLYPGIEFYDSINDNEIGPLPIRQLLQPVPRINEYFSNSASRIVPARSHVHTCDQHFFFLHLISRQRQIYGHKNDTAGIILGFI